MKGAVTGKVKMPAFEFQRNGMPVPRRIGHRPDYSLQITRPSRAVPSTKRASYSPITPRRPHVKQFDELAVIDITGTSDYGSITKIDCSGKKLTDVLPSALRVLTATTDADFGDNHLRLEPFSVMPSLEVLDLSCNGLQGFDFRESEAMAGDTRAWSSLHTLNVSFNGLRAMGDLVFLPRLSTLNLAHNGISVLPANLIHFSCLMTLNLSGNSLNGESVFETLATIPSLQFLNLDENGITHVPCLTFGFDALTTISLKNNKFELADDIEALLDLEQLRTVDISKNPLVLRKHDISIAQNMYAEGRVTLVTKVESGRRKKAILAGPLRTVAFDPLTLPPFMQGHIQALNRKARMRMIAPKEPEPDVDLFITKFDTRNEEEEDMEPEQHNGTLPTYVDDEGENMGNVWNEIPVTMKKRESPFRRLPRSEFERAFRQLEFIVTNPEMRVRPPAPVTSETETESEGMSDPGDTGDRIVHTPSPRRKGQFSGTAEKLAAKTEYTKTEVQEMLRTMEHRLQGVETELRSENAAGQTAIDVALDQNNFTELHKQYETVRAELLNTLNG